MIRTIRSSNRCQLNNSGPSPSLVVGLPTQQLKGMSLESSIGGLSQSQMGERVQYLESDSHSERQKRRLIESKLQNELQKEHEKIMAMEGAIVVTFQQYFGKVSEGIASLMSKPSPAVDAESGQGSIDQEARPSFSDSHDPAYYLGE